MHHHQSENVIARHGTEALKRGVVFDVGHGGGGFDFTIAQAAIEQGCPPDTIPSDIHVFSGNSPGLPYLPWVMNVVDAPVSFVDTRNNRRAGTQHLRPGGTIVADMAFGRPCQAPLSVR